MLGQAAEDSHLRTQRIALRHGADNALGRIFYDAEATGRIVLRQADGRLIAPLHLFRAQDRRLHHQHFDDDIGKRAHDLLLIGETGCVFLAGRSGAKQAKLFAAAKRPLCSANWPLACSPATGPAKTSSITR